MTHTSDLFSGLDLANISDGERLLKAYESWFERYPPFAKQQLQKRLANSDQVLGAWFELLAHESFDLLGIKVDVKDIDNTEKTPDFFVSHGGRNCYVEATIVNPRDNPSIVDRNLEDALCKLNTLHSSDFQIRLTVEGRIARTLNKNELVSKFGKLLSENDPVTVQQQILMGEWAVPYAEFKEEHWCLHGELLPISPDKMLDQRSPGLIVGPMGSFAGDASPEVRKTVSKKAGKYGSLDAPLIVAVNVLDPRFDREAELATLFGQEQIRYSPSHPRVPDEIVKKPDGVWIKRGFEARFKRLVGVIMFSGFLPWNPEGNLCLYLNPFVDHLELPEPLFQLPHAKGEDGILNRVEGIDIEMSRAAARSAT